MSYIQFYDLTIYSKAISGLKEFYINLGLPIVHEKEGDLVVFLIGNVEFAIHKTSNGNSEKPHPVSLSFVVDEFDKLVEELNSKSVSFDGPKLIHAGFHGIELRDPDGNYVNLFKAKQAFNKKM